MLSELLFFFTRIFSLILRGHISTHFFGVRVVMNETHLSVFHSVSERAHGKRSRNSVSSAGSLCFQFFFLSQARDFTTFTLHDLTHFYVERATINYHSCFHSR